MNVNCCLNFSRTSRTAFCALLAGVVVLVSPNAEIYKAFAAEPVSPRTAKQNILTPFIERVADNERYPGLVDAVNMQIIALGDLGDRLKENPDATLSDLVPDMPAEPGSDQDTVAWAQADPIRLAQAAEVVRVLLANSSDTSDSIKKGVLTEKVLFGGTNGPRHTARMELENALKDQLASVYDGAERRRITDEFRPRLQDAGRDLGRIPQTLQNAMRVLDQFAGKTRDKGQSAEPRFNETPAGQSIQELRSKIDLRAQNDQTLDGLIAGLMAEAEARVSSAASSRPWNATMALRPADKAGKIVTRDTVPSPNELMSREELTQYVKAHIDPLFTGMTRVLFEPGKYDPSYDAYMRDVLNVHVVAIKSPQREEVQKYYWNGDKTVPEWARFYPVSYQLQYDYEPRTLEEHLKILRSEEEERSGKPLKLDEKGRSGSERRFQESLDKSTDLMPNAIVGSMADIPDIAERYRELYALQKKQVDGLQLGGRRIGIKEAMMPEPEELVDRLIRGDEIYHGFLKDWYVILYYDTENPTRLIGGYIAEHWKAENMFRGMWVAYDDEHRKYEMGIRSFVICQAIVNKLNAAIDGLPEDEKYPRINWYSQGANINFTGGPEKPGLMVAKNILRPKQVDPTEDFLLQRVLNPEPMFKNEFNGKRIGWVLAVLLDVMIHRALEAQEAGQPSHMWDMMMKGDPAKKLVYDQAIRFVHFAFDRTSIGSLFFPPAFRNKGVEVVQVPKAPYLLRQADPRK